MPQSADHPILLVGGRGPEVDGVCALRMNTLKFFALCDLLCAVKSTPIAGMDEWTVDLWVNDYKLQLPPPSQAGFHTFKFHLPPFAVSLRMPIGAHFFPARASAAPPPVSAEHKRRGWGGKINLK